MNVEKQRIAIAEACGWKYQEGDPPVYGDICKRKGFFRSDGMFFPWNHKEAPPDYFSDLNAMYEAEKFLGKSIFLYSFELWRIVYGKDISLLEEYDEEGNCLAEGYEEQAVAAMIRATAAQKAEAFLKALKGWDE